MCLVCIDHINVVLLPISDETADVGQQLHRREGSKDMVCDMWDELVLETGERWLDNIGGWMLCHRIAVLVVKVKMTYPGMVSPMQHQLWQNMKSCDREAFLGMLRRIEALSGMSLWGCAVKHGTYGKEVDIGMVTPMGALLVMGERPDLSGATVELAMHSPGTEQFLRCCALEKLKRKKKDDDKVGYDAMSKLGRAKYLRMLGDG